MRAFKRLTLPFMNRKGMPAAPSRLRRLLNPWGVMRTHRDSTVVALTIAADIVGALEDELYALRTAADDLVDLLDDGMLASGIAEHLNCGEVERLADFLKAHDQFRAAELWLECHAESDDEGDSHYKGETSQLALTA
ncbi:hypothetical protein [Streptomyces sp. TBY4]|uniref:hypothetical protein n=1 Tax=Streptomyces sp. TBY4 TaxID=2962030 RepID=UPI0020B85E26|nr:hypothetical protein [Streptomyces sp. TBY4]MCP3755775.1 hypothetical protein [Streptomyces sp. TBY4]